MAMRGWLAAAALGLAGLGGCAATPPPAAVASAPLPERTGAFAHWLEVGVLVWDAPTEQVRLVAGDDVVPLVRLNSIDDIVQRDQPHLAGQPIWGTEDPDRRKVEQWLRGPVELQSLDASGAVVARTGVQLGSVLDALYAGAAVHETLGARMTTAGVSLALWAPTAQNVRLLRYDTAAGGTPTIVQPERKSHSGVWRLDGARSWLGDYYLWEVSVFVPETGRVETNLVTDPYSLNLAADSVRSQIVDLDDPATKPAGWDALARDLAEAPEDRSIYELHVRDFSIGADTLREDRRGTYLAFAEPDLPGSRHLAALAQAGLSDVHLLPTYDCATIPERRSERAEPAGLAGLPPDSEEQQARVAATAARDGFNWCYDPWHFFAPEGSYATTPDGTARIREFRQMVMSLDAMGLGTVLDVVFNHTTRAGQDERSVLDRIVPGYYHRLEADGKIATSTCCSNTASERVMMEKLMIDALLVWARDYKVSGFRFDLMGHHSKANLLRAREALSALSLRADRVDGRDLLIYGEGWNFGEVADNARFVQATQREMAGTGIGTFNDRFRDALRGGGCCDKGPAVVAGQGVATGIATAPNAVNSAADQRARALELADHLRAGLAGSLAGFAFETADGTVRKASDLDYGGQPVGYVSDPQESVNYAAAHDNLTLFDVGVYKLPRDISKDERVRWQNMATSFVLLAQGVPFLHAGQDLLRTKSLDHNSYDSGDWFNAIDFAGRRHGWGRGLPPERDNKEDWPEARGLLADDAYAMEPRHIARAAAHVRELLSIRKAEPLLRMRTAEEIEAKLHFLAGGKEAPPGLIAMALGSPDVPDLIIVFNATREASVVTAPSGEYLLHPVQAGSDDVVVREIVVEGTMLGVPALTAAVFVRRR